MKRETTVGYKLTTTYCSSFSLVAWPIPSTLVRPVAESCNNSRRGGFPTFSRFNARPSFPRRLRLSRSGRLKNNSETLSKSFSSAFNEFSSSLIPVTPLSNASLSHVIPYHEQMG